MRILNIRNLANIPSVDSPMGAVDREKLHKLREYRQQQLAARARQHAQAEAASARREAMLKRSLQMNGHAVAHARANQGSGQVPQYGVVNPHLGFVDEVPASSKDFSAHTARDAQEFNNKLAAKDIGYTSFQDFPLVLDSKGGDFSGILVDETHSPDFSERIFNDTRQEFGYVPQRPRRKHRR